MIESHPLRPRLFRLRPSRLRLALGGIALTLLLGLGTAAAWAGWLQSYGNFHTVVAGEIYRSAQPSPAELEDWTRQHGIRSVLNLRGASTAAWYRDEVATSERLGLVHADFQMSSSKLMPEARARELIALMQSLPKPMLIHCAWGADRSGLASALYLAVTGKGEEMAEAQISFRYGHVSLPLSAAWPMDESWEAMERPLGFES